MKNKTEITKKIILTAQYFDKELPAPIVEIYISALSRFGDDDISQALTEAIQKCRFFPKVAELVEMIEGDEKVNALAAWDTVLTTIRRHGRRWNGSLGQVIDQAIRIVGGFERMCDYPEAQLHFLQKDFVEAFEAASHKAFDSGRVLDFKERRALA